jgi:ArsR family transcriptional regulator
MTTCEDFFKALSDDTRQSILKMLEPGEKCVCEIVQAFEVSQPTISHHLDILKRAGLIESRRKGQNIYYSLNKKWFRECCSDFLSGFECCADLAQTRKIKKRSEALNSQRNGGE